jgi:hypothetical protein
MNNIRVPEGQTLGADRDITDEAKDRDLLALMAAILLSGATVAEWPDPMGGYLCNSAVASARKRNLCNSAVASARKILAAIDASTGEKTDSAGTE